MAIVFSYVESTNIVTVTGGTSGTPATFADFVFADRTVKTSAASGGSGCVLLGATTVTGASQVVTLTYPMRPVEYKALYLSVSVSQGAGNALSGGEQFTVDGTTAIWVPITGASASGQKDVPCANSTHLFQVGQTVILIDISAPGTWETDIVSAITEGVSITLTNNNTNSYATGDILGIYQYETVPVGAFATFTTSYAYGQIATITYDGFDNNTTTVEQPIWGVIWDWSAVNTYRIDCFIQIGDGTNSTAFTETAKIIIFSAFTTANNQKLITIKNNATLTFGVVLDETKKSITTPCTIVDLVTGYIDYFITNASTTTGILNSYGTSFIGNSARGYIYIAVAGTGASRIWNNRTTNCHLTNTSTNCDIYNLHHIGTYCMYSCSGTIDKITAVGSTTTAIPIYLYTAAAVSNMDLIDPDKVFVAAAALTGTSNLTNINSDIAWVVDFNTSCNGTVYRRYTCDINICDKDGTALPGVTVDCEDTTGTAAWAAGTIVTNASGNIDQQNINYTKYVKGLTSAGTVTTYSPHKFTISKSGYQTLVLENITVSEAIDWHLELQDEPAAGGKHIPSIRPLCC